MVYLAAAVAIVGLLCALNLLFTFGVVRRLREHTAHLDRLLNGSPGAGRLAVGELIGDFATSSVDGEPVRRDGLADHTLVGFFAPGCQPCEQLLPQFLEAAEAMPLAGQVLAVVFSPEPDWSAEYVAKLRPVARVVAETADGDLHRAFRVDTYPRVYTLDSEGLVTGDGLPAATPLLETVHGH